MKLDQRGLGDVALCDIALRPAGLERGARIGNVKLREPTCALVSGYETRWDFRARHASRGAWTLILGNVKSHEPNFALARGLKIHIFLLRASEVKNCVLQFEM